MTGQQQQTWMETIGIILLIGTITLLALIVADQRLAETPREIPTTTESIDR